MNNNAADITIEISNCVVKAIKNELISKGKNSVRTYYKALDSFNSISAHQDNICFCLAYVLDLISNGKNNLSIDFDLQRNVTERSLSKASSLLKSFINIGELKACELYISSPNKISFNLLDI